MFSTSTQFDAASAFSGGGFMTTQATQLNDSSPAPAKSREIQGLVPVTVKQISEAFHSGDEKTINGVHLTNVTLVGMAFEKVERNTDVNFILDDGTGRIKCRRWVNEAFDAKDMDEIRNASNGYQAPIPSSNPLYAQYSMDGLKDCDKLVLDYLEQHSDMSDEWGIHVDELTRKLKASTGQDHVVVKDSKMTV